jgi:hypothetical protein
MIYDPTDPASLDLISNAIKPNSKSNNLPIGCSVLLGISNSSPSRPRPKEIEPSQARQWAIENGVDLFLGDLSYPSYDTHTSIWCRKQFIF